MAAPRSNPVKMRKEKEKIVRDLEERQHVPQADRMFPDLSERIFRVTGKPLLDAIEMKKLRKNPPPVIRGGKVTGFKKPRSDA